jgi:glycosyltransferase involved in cell wall biosynthesis
VADPVRRSAVDYARGVPGESAAHRGPLVSIVTPTLNRADLIEPTLRSIRSQGYAEIEHIVVDGGSTDETLAILGRYEGTYRMRWISEPDPGMYAAVNKGLAQAQGQILAYLNSDDLYFPWTIEVVVDAFRRHPDVDVVFGEAIEITDATGGQTMSWVPPFNLDYLRRSGFMWQPAVFWRRRVLEQEGGFDERLRFAADLEYWMRLGEARHRFLKVNEFLAVARHHPGTLSMTQKGPAAEELRAIRARHAPTGPAQRWLARLDRIRKPIWARIYWLAFVAQSLVPARLRRGPWSRLLGAGQTRISYRAVAFRWLPGLGRRWAGHLLYPSRYWLHPPE